MVWVVVFGVIALGGLGMVIGYAVWLAHKAADVFSEVAVLGERVGQLADLLGQVGAPPPAGTTVVADGVLEPEGDVPWPGRMQRRI